MKGKWGIIALLGGIGILAIILLIVFGDNNTSKSVKEEAENNQPVNWEISYDITDRSPYGTFLFYELLKKKYSEEKKKIKVIDDDFRKELNDTVNKKPEIYFLISNSMKLNKDEKIALKSFVENGNYAFISIEEFPETFKEIINETHFIETTRMERTKINFYPSSLRNKKSYYEFFYIYENEKTHGHGKALNLRQIIPMRTITSKPVRKNMIMTAIPVYMKRIFITITLCPVKWTRSIPIIFHTNTIPTPMMFL